MICKICGSEVEKSFDVKVMHKHDAEYFHCGKCGLLFAGNPYWLNEAYKSAINISDTGIMSRNIHFSKVVSVLIYFLFNKNGRFVDYAGGYGIFTRLMRDMGFDFYWTDPYCENFLARGFEYNQSLKGNINLITAFEVFEHLADPLNEIEKMLEISDNIVLSTVLLPYPIPQAGEWWYYGFDHGQHISFYSEKTLKEISGRFGLYYYTFYDTILIGKKKLNRNKINILLRIPAELLFRFVKNKVVSKTNSDFEFIKKINT